MRAQSRRSSAVPTDIATAPVPSSPKRVEPSAPAKRPELGGILFAASGGALLYLAGPGVGLWPLAFVGYVPLVLAIESGGAPSMRRAVALGGVFGVVLYAGMCSWLVQGFRYFAGFPWALAAVLALFGWVAQAIQTVALAGSYHLLRTRAATAAPIALLLSAVLAEALVPQVFPYHQAYALLEAPRLAQVVELGGPLTATALVASVNAALVAIAAARTTSAPFPRAAVAAASLVVLATAAFGEGRLSALEPMTDERSGFAVAVLQPSMAPVLDDRGARRALAAQLEMTRHLAADARDAPALVVWPEAAIRILGRHDERDYRALGFGGGHGAVLVGLDRIRARGEIRTNSAVLVGRDGLLRGDYDKVHLFPLAETLPFGELAPWLYDVLPYAYHLHAGAGPRGFDVEPGLRVAPLICYEDILPGYVRRVVRETRPGVLVDLTNDVWFGDTPEPAYHLALARLRAIEHRRPLVRAANAGISAIVDPAGRVVARGELFDRTVLRARVHPSTRETLYGKLGPIAAYAAALVAAWLLVRARLRRVSAP